MLKAGRTQTLTVSRTTEHGIYLADEEQAEVLLPNRYTSLADKVGDRKEVFVYHDSEDRLVATTEQPLLRVGEAGYLRVVDKTAHGAFLDWGLHGKDLFLPNRNQQGGILIGHSYVVYLYEDNVTGRCVATTKLKSFVNNDPITVAERQRVTLLVASESEIGYRVIVENRHWGMLYRNQLFRPVAVGDRLTGYVRRITGDNRIDVSLQQTGYGRGAAATAARQRRLPAPERRQLARRDRPAHADEQEGFQTVAGRAAQKRRGGDDARGHETAEQWLRSTRRNGSRARLRTTSYSSARCWPTMRRRSA